MDKWIDEQMDVWIDGQMDRWMNGMYNTFFRISKIHQKNYLKVFKIIKQMYTCIQLFKYASTEHKGLYIHINKKEVRCYYVCRRLI